ncbi:MAG: CDP-alcohol phosphatidyltransferase family protein [Desulforhabdus sp.]|jgi:cardiolipin synthase|nr:CDP-alcohol phosphatidyltransferase family protein [Desulforhabdus sp.]
MTIPNALTLIRIFLTPVIVWLLLDARLNYALVVFFIAGLTDGLDGLIARVFHQKTKLGAYLDPLADKLLLVSSFILLGHLGLVPIWLSVIIVSRDALILLGLMTLMFHNVAVEIKPSITSKLTTLLQLLTVLVVLSSSYHSLPRWVYSILFLFAATFSIASGLQYVLKGLQLLDARRTNSQP